MNRENEIINFNGKNTISLLCDRDASDADGDNIILMLLDYIYLVLYPDEYYSICDDMFFSQDKSEPLLGEKLFYEKFAERLKEILIKNPCFPRKFTAVIDTYYVDYVYRDIYYHHFSSKHLNMRRTPLRIFFFEGDCVKEVKNYCEEKLRKKWIGLTVIQPNKVLGRTLFNPKYFLPNGTAVRTAPYEFLLNGMKLSVNAFQYMMQDEEATTCAEVSLLNLLDYYATEYKEYNITLPADIEREERFTSIRAYPSGGMNARDILHAMVKKGFAPQQYKTNTLGQTIIKRYMYYYVESAVPFIAILDGNENQATHALVCVGHTQIMKEDLLEASCRKFIDLDKNTYCWLVDTADACKGIVTMDDNRMPYAILGFQTEESKSIGTTVTKFDSETQRVTPYKRINVLCVPLYKRVFLDAIQAEEIFSSLLLSEWGIYNVASRVADTVLQKKIMDKIPGKSQDQPLIRRIFLASSRTYSKERLKAFTEAIKNAVNSGTRKSLRAIREFYSNTAMPRFVWVCELYSIEGYFRNQIVGEILLDATAENGLNSLLLIHYPHLLARRQPDESINALSNFNVFMDWTGYRGFGGNLREV